MDSACEVRGRYAVAPAELRPDNRRRAFSRTDCRIGDGGAKPFTASRVARLLGEGLIDSSVDVGILAQPVHAERVEIMLGVIAAALTRKPLREVAPWLYADQKRGTPAERMAAFMKAYTNDNR